jgi:hypothetical protein
MSVGEFKGELVQEARVKVRASMIKNGVAFAYAKPEGLVISRSADECVVALMDQWYLDYGEQKWRVDAERCASCYSHGLYLLTVGAIQPACQDGHVFQAKVLSNALRVTQNLVLQFMVVQ